jgi:hypothetical protein
MFAIAIIDDKFPYDINTDAPGKFFPEDKIKQWLKETERWTEEPDLKKLLERIFDSDLYAHKEIEVIGFLFPSALLNYLSETEKQPDLIIFDWEYQTRNQDTKKQLIEVIKVTNAFIFIYTALADTIWRLLVKQEMQGVEDSKNIFEENNNRIQLLKKGDKRMSLFSSEDFIMQFIMSHFEKAYEFKMGEHSVRFEENNFLKSPSDILILESVLGKHYLLDKLRKANFEISNDTIESIFSDVKLKFYLSNDRKYLMETDFDSYKEQYGPLTELSFLGALSKFGAKTIDKTLERGIAEV